MTDAAALRWNDALCAARLFAADPAGYGGIVVRAPAGPVRDAWLAALRGLLPEISPLRKMPPAISDDQLLGGLDLTATLSTGRLATRKGLLAEADGGVIIIPMAERLDEAASRLCLALDTGQAGGAGDGAIVPEPARIGLILLDEGASPEEGVPAALCDRCAFLVDLTKIGPRDTGSRSADPIPVTPAAATASEGQIESLVTVALALGLSSLRPALQALRAARQLAQADGRKAIIDEDIVTAARLVLAPRARQRPMSPDDASTAAPPPPADDGDPGDSRESDRSRTQLADVVLAAVQAALPPALLDDFDRQGQRDSRLQGHGSGARRLSPGRGRPAGVRRGQPGGKARLHLVETLRAAAPWQKLRQQMARRTDVVVTRDDFRIRRFVDRAEATMIFAVDASGSAAVERLAETKGAVELLLAEAYVRRTQVALVAFRGVSAELLLPPTRSLARAKRCLSGLAGGGGTPLASGLEASLLVAEAARRKGRTAYVILLTDGRANIARDGSPGREQAGRDAMAAAQQFRAAGIPVAMVDIAARPREESRRFAAALGARYAVLPRADAGAMRDIARALDPAAR